MATLLLAVPLFTLLCDDSHQHDGFKTENNLLLRHKKHLSMMLIQAHNLKRILTEKTTSEHATERLFHRDPKAYANRATVSTYNLRWRTHISWVNNFYAKHALRLNYWSRGWHASLSRHHCVHNCSFKSLSILQVPMYTWHNITLYNVKLTSITYPRI